MSNIINLHDFARKKQQEMRKTKFERENGFKLDKLLQCIMEIKVLTKCNTCGDYHADNEIPLSCIAGDGE